MLPFGDRPAQHLWALGAEGIHPSCATGTASLHPGALKAPLVQRETWFSQNTSQNMPPNTCVAYAEERNCDASILTAKDCSARFIKYFPWTREREKVYSWPRSRREPKQGLTVRQHGDSAGFCCCVPVKLVDAIGKSQSGQRPSTVSANTEGWPQHRPPHRPLGTFESNTLSDISSPTASLGAFRFTL